VANVKNHFILNGINPNIRAWRGPRDIDYSNEEWKVEFKRPIEQQSLELDLQMDIHGIVENAFQQVDEPTTLEERTMEIIEEAFVVVDGLHEEANAKDGSNNEDE
jgi:hypothetical protein